MIKTVIYQQYERLSVTLHLRHNFPISDRKTHDRLVWLYYRQDEYCIVYILE